MAYLWHNSNQCMHACSLWCNNACVGASSGWDPQGEGHAHNDAHNGTFIDRF